MPPTRRALALAVVLLAAGAAPRAEAATRTPTLLGNCIARWGHDSEITTVRCALVVLSPTSTAKVLASSKKPFLRVSGVHVPSQDVYRNEALIVACAHQGPNLVSWTLSADRRSVNVELQASDELCDETPNGQRLTMRFYA